MDFTIVQNDNGLPEMTFDKAGDISNNILLSLVVQRGSWFQNPEFGSRLHLLRKAKNTALTERLARDYCREALQWLLDTGKVTVLDIATERDLTVNRHRLKLVIEATQANGRKVTFEHFVEVV